MAVTITNETSVDIFISLCEWKDGGRYADYMKLPSNNSTQYPESDARGFLMAMQFDGSDDPTVFYLKPSYTGVQIKGSSQVWSGDQLLSSL
jgi:hypothetical protein